MGIRSIIDEIEAIGFGAKYEPQSDKSDIRIIVNQEVRKYAIKFFTSLFLIIPVFVLIYLIPITNPDFITAHNTTNGVPVYVFLNAFFATIIQVVMGS